MEIEHSYFCKQLLPKFSQGKDLFGVKENNLLSQIPSTTNDLNDYAKKVQAGFI